MRNWAWNRWRQHCAAISAAVVMSATVLVAQHVGALGLGEIDTRSALNERFAAEIELLDTRDLEASEVIASLASTDDFRRVGVERFFFLTGLQFDVVRNSRGNLVITATSNQPITEPYLNFLVEVLWPSGRLLKEYTVLLDPPTFTHSAAAPVAAPQRETTDIASAGRIQRDQPSASPSSVSPAQSSRPTAIRSSTDGTYGRTINSDTMWAIASQTLPSNNVTPQQNMIAIQRLNPNAFIDNNVNLLKEGVILRLPSESDAQQTTNSDAIAEINEQNRAWRSGTPARAVAANNAEQTPTQQTQGQADAAAIDATSRGPGNADAAADTNDGRLRIVAADSAGVVDGTNNTGASEAETSVAGDPAAQQRIEALARQVDELTYQLDLQKRGVEEQISSREKQINLKDQQISQLQAQLRAANEAGNQASSQASTTDTVAEATPFWQQPMVLGGVLAGLAFLLAGVLFKRRQSNAADELEIEDFDTAEPNFELADSASELATPIADADLVSDLSDADEALAGAAQDEASLSEELSTALDDDELSDDDLFGPADSDSSDGNDKSAQTTDVISEADIYIAYGRYPQAIALLQGAVESNPADHAVRVRLLEVCAETKDAQGYAEQSSLLKQFCDDAGPLSAADSLYSSLDEDFRTQVDELTTTTDVQADDDSILSGAAGAAAGAGAAVVAGAAALFSSDSADEESATDEDSGSEAEPFAFDTTVTDNSDVDAPLDDFELDLDTDLDADLGEVDEFSAPEVPSVNTDEFATNVDMEPAILDQRVEQPLDDAIESAEAVEDFELDLDLDSEESLDDSVDASLADISLDAESDLGTDLDTDIDTGIELDATAELADSVEFESLEQTGSDLNDTLDLELPDETSELERVVAEADDDQLLDEIERSLDELEADGLLTPELDEDAQFSFDDDADTSATKLDLARAYIDMGDDDGAREILGEVISEGDSNQQGEASELLNKL